MSKTEDRQCIYSNKVAVGNQHYKQCLAVVSGHSVVPPPPQIVAHGPVQRLLRAGVCVHRTRRQPTHGSSEGGGAGVPVPPRALWDWEDQAHTHLQSGPQVPADFKALS